MGMVYADITLENLGDTILAQSGYRKEIRAVTVKALVDSGTADLIIGEDICAKLGLRSSIKADRCANLPDGTPIPYQVTEGVEIHWKNRKMVTNAVVSSQVNGVLMGRIPLEGMDLMVHPMDEIVVGAHGDVQETMLVGITLEDAA
jgi:clan AA aspartic protease